MSPHVRCQYFPEHLGYCVRGSVFASFCRSELYSQYMSEELAPLLCAVAKLHSSLEEPVHL